MCIITTAMLLSPEKSKIYIKFDELKTRVDVSDKQQYEGDSGCTNPVDFYSDYISCY